MEVDSSALDQEIANYEKQLSHKIAYSDRSRKSPYRFGYGLLQVVFHVPETCKRDISVECQNERRTPRRRVSDREESVRDVRRVVSVK